jgi:predicted ArsR family transcriptional regulator
MPRIRMLHAIGELEGRFEIRNPNAEIRNSYLKAILRDKFGHEDLERLSLEELTMVRNTLAARANSKSRKQKAEMILHNCPF